MIYHTPCYNLAQQDIGKMTFLTPSVEFRYRMGSHMMQFSPPCEFLGFFYCVCHIISLSFLMWMYQLVLQEQWGPHWECCEAREPLFAWTKGQVDAGFGFRRSAASRDGCANRCAETGLKCKAVVSCKKKKSKQTLIQVLARGPKCILGYGDFPKTHYWCRLPWPGTHPSTYSFNIR